MEQTQTFRQSIKKCLARLRGAIQRDRTPRYELRWRTRYTRVPGYVDPDEENFLVLYEIRPWLPGLPQRTEIDEEFVPMHAVIEIGVYGAFFSFRSRLQERLRDLNAQPRPV